MDFKDPVLRLREKQSPCQGGAGREVFDRWAGPKDLPGTRLLLGFLTAIETGIDVATHDRFLANLTTFFPPVLH
jgi:hypothetical protein